MDNRQKEEQLVESLKHPSEKDSTDISKLINSTIKAGGKVYLMTDWHLWIRKEKGKSECHKRKEFNKIIESLKVINPSDLLIYMGDLVDGEFQDKDQLKNVLLPMNFKKVMVIGNNDLFGVTFYKSCGFDYVVRSFVWSDVIFSHMPIKHEHQTNVCGHLHGFTNLWVPYNNHIEVGWCGGRNKPIELMDVIKAQPKYAKAVKECPEHFEECEINNAGGFFMSQMQNYGEYTISNDNGLFMSQLLTFVEDPYHDDE